MHGGCLNSLQTGNCNTNCFAIKFFVASTKAYSDKNSFATEDDCGTRTYISHCGLCLIRVDARSLTRHWIVQRLERKEIQHHQRLLNGQPRIGTLAGNFINYRCSHIYLFVNTVCKMQLIKGSVAVCCLF